MLLRLCQPKLPAPLLGHIYYNGQPLLVSFFVNIMKEMCSHWWRFISCWGVCGSDEGGLVSGGCALNPALLATVRSHSTRLTVPRHTARHPAALWADLGARLPPDGQIKAPLNIITVPAGEANSSCQKWLQIAAPLLCPPPFLPSYAS